jgi:hypothetical protein
MGGTCGVQWGVCPEHGQTLRASGGICWCTVCGRTWAFDRLGEKCPEPASAVVRDLLGDEVAVCHGHALAARVRLVGCAVVELGEG